MVEGVNTPIARLSSINLEVVQPEQDRILLPSMKKRPHPIRNFLFWIIFLALLGYGGFKAYQIYWPKWLSSRPVSQNSAPSDGLIWSTSTMPDYTATGTGVVSAVSIPGSSSSTGLSLGTSTPATTTPATTTPPVAVSPISGPVLKINNNSLGYLNVRSNPSSSGKIITQVHPGETYSYIDSQYDWYKITLSNGQIGWVSGQYVTLQQ